MAKKNEMENLEVTIPAINIQLFNIKLVGDSPLIVHKWDEKAKKEMLDKHMKKATKGKEIRNPFMEYVKSLYWLTEIPENPTQEDIENAKFGFPTVAFKSAAVDAGYQAGLTKNKTISRGAFHVMGDMAEIIGTPLMREDMVRVGMGTPDLRYRAEFKKWSVNLTIRYNANVMSIEQIINLFNMGGFACGIGEWRPAKDGSYGMYHVE